MSIRHDNILDGGGQLGSSWPLRAEGPPEVDGHPFCPHCGRVSPRAEAGRGDWAFGSRALHLHSTPGGPAWGVLPMGSTLPLGHLLMPLWAPAGPTTPDLWLSPCCTVQGRAWQSSPFAFSVF